MGGDGPAVAGCKRRSRARSFIRNFLVRGEPGLERVVAGAPGQVTRRRAVHRIELPNSPSSPAAWPFVTASCAGQWSAPPSRARSTTCATTCICSGTFVPLYGLNNMFGQIPILGPFLGGSKEGLLGITYDAVGPPSAPRITVNPVSAIAPGLLRKFIPVAGQPRPQFHAADALNARSDRLKQDVRFLPNDNLITPSGVNFFFADHMSFSRQSLRASLTLQTAGLDRWRACLAVRGGKPGFSTNAVSTPRPLSSSPAAISTLGSVERGRAFLKRLARGLGGLHQPRRGHAPARSPRWRALSSPR